tara:strand:+ start:858 stop:1085 length:228 start_codon:yes stop_codon:yes gene_type:complete
MYQNKKIIILGNCANKDWKKNCIIALGVNENLKLYIKKYNNFDFSSTDIPSRDDGKHSYGANEKLFFDTIYVINK